MAIITFDRQKEIDREIDNLLLSTQTSYPEDGLLDILKKIGVKVFQASFGDKSQEISGAVYRGNPETNEQPQILVNVNEPKERKVFTIAHELGHYILHKTDKYRIDKYNYLSNTQEAKDETEANYFAASLLMPKDKFISVLNQTSDMKATAKYFGVSEAAVSIRLKWITRNN